METSIIGQGQEVFQRRGNIGGTLQLPGAGAYFLLQASEALG